MTKLKCFLSNKILAMNIIGYSDTFNRYKIRLIRTKWIFMFTINKLLSHIIYKLKVKNNQHLIFF